MDVRFFSSKAGPPTLKDHMRQENNAKDSHSRRLPLPPSTQPPLCPRPQAPSPLASETGRLSLCSKFSQRLPGSPALLPHPAWCQAAPCPGPEPQGPDLPLPRPSTALPRPAPGPRKRGQLLRAPSVQPAAAPSPESQAQCLIRPPGTGNHIKAGPWGAGWSSVGVSPLCLCDFILLGFMPPRPPPPTPAVLCQSF